MESTLLSKTSKGALALNSDIPSLALIRSAYGAELAVEWLSLLIEDFFDYSEQQKVTDSSRTLEASSLILASYYYLNVAELLYFFGELKLGRYGKFYGVVGLNQLMDMFNTFLRQRNEDIDIIQRRQTEEHIQNQRHLINGYTAYLRHLEELADKGDAEAIEILQRHRRPTDQTPTQP